MHAQTYLKIKKRKIITRSNSTGFKECPDLWIRRTNDGNVINWCESFGVERVLEARWISGEWQWAPWHHQPTGKWERRKMSQLGSGSKRPNHRVVSLLWRGNDRIQNQSHCCCTFVPKRAFLDIQTFLGGGERVLPPRKVCRDARLPKRRLTPRALWCRNSGVVTAAVDSKYGKQLFII